MRHPPPTAGSGTAHLAYPGMRACLEPQGVACLCDACIARLAYPGMPACREPQGAEGLGSLELACNT